MSGICGLVDFANREASAEALEAMVRSGAYRGPHGIRKRFAGAAGLAHLALYSTRESEGEAQPLASPDGAVVLLADARLDNRLDLIQGLGAEASASDAELILAAFLRWGPACPEHLLGDFAFVVWDGKSRELFCACDALGLKPLHYARVGSLFCFASEAQQILQHPAVPRRLDELSLGLYLCGELHMESGRTMFDDVRRLPAAHRLVANADGVRLERYWDVELGKRTVYKRSEEYAEHLQDLLRRVVSDRLRASGEVIGIAMSGGLDSTSIAALAQQELLEKGGPRLLALSFAFDRLKDCDEGRYVGAMAEELGLEVEYIQAERHWALDDSDAWKPSLESPLMGWDGCFHELYGRLRERGARVVMTGNCGDEMLGGVLFLDRIWRHWWLKQAPQILRRARRRGDSVSGAIYRYWISRLLPAGADQALRRILKKTPPPANVPAWLDRDFVRRTRLDEWFSREAASWRKPTEPRGLRQIVRHPGAFWTDRSAARFGLEARHPFMDRRLVEFLLSIPLTQLVDIDCYKPLLRRAMSGILPDVVRDRADKSQLGSYIDFSLRNQGRQRVERLLRSPLAADVGFLDRKELLAAFRDYSSGMPDAYSRRLWYAITVEVWLRQHHQSLDLGERGTREAGGARISCDSHHRPFADTRGYPA